MIRRLRRFNKIILVFGGTLLMVLFLVPSLGQRASGTSPGSTIARFDGGSITAKQYQIAQNEVDALHVVRGPTNVGGQIQIQSVANLLAIESIEHWLLLVHLADQAGLVGGPSDAATLLDELASESARYMGMPPAQVRAYYEETYTAAKKQKLPETVDNALAKSYGVFRMLMAYQNSQPLSTPEAQAIARRIFDTVVADLLILPASHQGKNLPAPDDARIAAHFEKYKAVNPNDDEMGIGYLRPPSVKIGTLRIDRAAVSTLITLNPVDVNAYWRQNKTRLGEDFAAARVSAEEELRRQEVDKLLQRVRETVESRIKLSISAVGKGNANVQPISLAEIEQIVRKTLGSETQPTTALIPSDDQWKTTTELTAMQPIADASWHLGSQELTFAQVVMSMSELKGPPNPILAPVMNSLKVGVPFGPLTDTVGNVYYFLVSQARPQSPPDSVDEVKDRVLADIAMLDGLDALAAKAEDYRKELVEKGSSALLNTEALGARLISNMEITRTSVKQTGGIMSLPALDKPEFRNRVLDAVTTWDQMKPVDEIPADQRVVAYPSKGMKGLILAQITKRRPLTREQIKSGEVQILNQAYNDILDLRRSDYPFSYERLSARLHLKYAGRTAKIKEVPKEEGEAAPKDASSGHNG